MHKLAIAKFCWSWTPT